MTRAVPSSTASQAERSRSLRIGLLESGFNLVATLPADVFLTERLAQLQPDMVIVDAESEARDALEHVTAAVYEIMLATKNMQEYELQVVAAQDRIAVPEHCFSATRL